MTSLIENQINPVLLNFKSRLREEAYGAWGIQSLKTTFYGAMLGSALLSMVLFGLQVLILGRFEWVIAWTNVVIASTNSLLFGLIVRFTNVQNRSQLDIWGALFVSIGQFGQFWIAFELPELGGPYLLVNVLLTLVGNASFASVNFRFLSPIVLTVLIMFLLKLFLWDDLEASQLAYQSTMALIFASVGLTSGYVMERSARINYLNQTWLEQQQQALLSKNKELEQFAYIASHDLQEPLRSVTSFSQLIDEEYRDKMDAEGVRYLDYLVEASHRMRDLIKGLLDYSRIGREAQMLDIDTAQCLQKVLVDMSSTIIEQRAQVTHEGLPSIMGYEVEFRQLFQNLISNAIKFRREGQTPTVHIHASLRGAFWEFVVADNGIGIAPEHYERIFLIFQRLHTREVYEGTGIGLSYCRKIVELHGGTMWLQSEIGQGSQFYFTIPTASRKWIQN